MEESTKKRLQSVMRSMTAPLNQEFRAAKQDAARRLLEVFCDSRICFCTENYLRAEIDFSTAGDRGLGRMSDHIPRFGAYFRREMTAPEVDVDAVYNALLELLLTGYTINVLFSKTECLTSEVTVKEELLEKWIPSIYSIDPRDPSVDNTLNLCQSFLPGPGEKVSCALRVPVDEFSQREKTVEILTYISFAGFVLRDIEARGIMFQ